MIFFVKVTPPPQEESKCQNAQFLQWILKDNDVYFQRITASEILGNSFIVKNIGFLHNMLPPPYCVTGPRWVNHYRTISSLCFIWGHRENHYENLLIFFKKKKTKMSVFVPRTIWFQKKTSSYHSLPYIGKCFKKTMKSRLVYFYVSRRLLILLSIYRYFRNWIILVYTGVLTFDLKVAYT